MKFSYPGTSAALSRGALLLPLLFGLHQGCGVEDRTVSEGSGGSGGAQGGAKGDAGDDGEGGEGGAGPETCGEDDTPCDVDGQSLCKGGSCVPCTDITDDSACAVVYGAGNICTGGMCREGCRDSSDCNGLICDATSLTCQECGQDVECSLATPAEPYCHTADGTCNVAPAPCTPSNEFCNDDSGWCCAGTCHAGAGAERGCCANADCASNNCNLTTHLCQPVGCSEAVPVSRFYVNSEATADQSGVGSHECPFTNLNTALANIPGGLTSEFTICTTGTFSGTNVGSWPRYVPTHVVLDGRYCENNPTRTVLEVQDNHPGVYFVEPGPAGMHGFDVAYQGDRLIESYTSVGINVTNGGQAGPITVSDVTIDGFTWGIAASSNARLLLGAGLLSSTNGRGLSVAGPANVGIEALLDGEDASARAMFNQNKTGIFVNGATLVVHGAHYTGGSSTNARTVIANGNELAGLWVAGASNVTLDYFSASSNPGAGFVVFSGEPTVKVTQSVFAQNGRGIEVREDAANRALGGLDFGTAATGAGAGNNYIFGSTGAGICIFPAATGRLDAMGNNFSSTDGGGKDCRTAVPAATNLTHDPDCSQPVDATQSDNINAQNCVWE